MKDLTQKWKEILEAEDAPKFKNKKVKKATALMLENQFNWMNKNGYTLNEATATAADSIDPNSDGYSGDGFFHKIAIPMVRRTFPQLIAHEIVGVQPLNGPVGLAFAMRFIADQEYDGATGTELGYNSIDKDHTGPYDTETGEKLGSSDSPDMGLGMDGDAIKEVSMTLEKDQVEAKTRKIRTRWSIEVAQDIENMHGLNLEEEMQDVMSYEVSAEIDRELIAEIRDVADSNLTTVDYENDLDGRWETEKYKNLYNLMIRRANRVAVNTRRGPANWAVADPNLCAALETLPTFSTHPVSGDVNTAQFGVAKIGSMEGRFTIYRDTFHDQDEILLGFLGVNSYDTGVVYLPYVQLMLQKVTDFNSFQPTMGMFSRYAIHKHLFGASNYYQKIKVDNLHSYES